MDDAPESSSSQDFLDGILSEMQKIDKNSDGIKGKPEDSTYQYAIFRIGDARILVRSNSPYSMLELGEKKHSFLENLKKVTFEPRIEYLPNGGAMELGAEEWIWNYTKSVFKMSESHLLYRTSYKIDHVLQIDGISMRIDKQEPPPDALGILSSRSVMMEQMIAQLESLEPGDYMVFQEKDRPLRVVAKCEPDHRDGVSIEAMRIKRDDCQKSSDRLKDEDFFHGFCRDVPLQWQIVQGRAPQMLLAKDSPTSQFMPSKNSREKLQRKKTNFKRKIQEKEAEREEAKRNKTIDWDDPNLYADFTNPSIVPMDYVKKTSKFRRGGRGRGHRGMGGAFRGRGGAYRGRGRGRGGGGASGESRNADGSGPSTSSSSTLEYPMIP
ncbi:hypothetical protein GCK72_011617 [Caenorhabditis remanei]|uniref:Uncharacterized protein n=1 Tax=Caenorhabditis remanei TaxID=31234 RepID=A0A6A5H954_CAERE|nr:hypothetical protein GCK72_011617 [Caenorhabditis remanei]KAF1763351.1 hypothetical protein GCK72_011617 [Caenorhabditis remanei]